MTHHRPEIDGSSRTAAMALLLCAGVLAGAQLGKIAPLVPWYRDELGFSLVYVGWLTSTIGVFVALAALPVSLFIDRLGLYRVVAAGSVALAAGGILLAMVDGAWATLVARAIEGLGYLVLVIAIPAILNTVAPPRQKAPLLAIWGGFVPVGFALADFGAAAVPAFGSRPYLLAISVVFAALALASCALLGRVDDPALAPASGGDVPPATASLTPPVLLVAASFGFYVVLSIAFFAFLPAAAFGDAVALTIAPGLVALLVPIGNILAGIGMAGRGRRVAALLASAGFVVSAATAMPAFTAGDPVVATVSAVLFAIAGGVTASALFASVPFIVPAAGSASVVIGIICQAGGIMTLVGPPLGGWVIERMGWSGFGYFLLATSLIGLALIMPVLRRT